MIFPTIYQPYSYYDFFYIKVIDIFWVSRRKRFKSTAKNNAATFRTTPVYDPAVAADLPVHMDTNRNTNMHHR